jgi:hypothetical protein
MLRGTPRLEFVSAVMSFPETALESCRCSSEGYCEEMSMRGSANEEAVWRCSEFPREVLETMEPGGNFGSLHLTPVVVGA